MIKRIRIKESRMKVCIICLAVLSFWVLSANATILGTAESFAVLGARP